MSSRRKIQITRIGLLLGVVILVSTLALSRAAGVESPITEHKYLLIEQDCGRVNADEVFIVEYEVSFPLSLSLNLVNISIEKTVTVGSLDFLEIYHKDMNCEIVIFLSHTHLRIKINTSTVGIMNWNIKMYDDSWVSEEIQGTVIFDRIVIGPIITSAWISDYNETDCYAWVGTFNFTFRWNPEEEQWDSVPKEDP